MANDPDNPYRPPISNKPPVIEKPPMASPGGEFAPCPNCRSTNAKKIKWTFWGGALGPKMFTHVRCNNCFTKYNGKKGTFNTTPIAMYIVISSVIGVVICLLLLVSFRG